MQRKKQGVLTMTIEVWLIIALVLSVSINGILIWFGKEQSRQLLYVSQNIGDLVELMDNYREHLTKVYQLEMFYGDETLEYLMSHTRSLLVILEDYDDIYKISLPTEPSEAGDQEIERSSTQEDEETEEKEIIPVDKENVFYAGTRGGNS